MSGIDRGEGGKVWKKLLGGEGRERLEVVWVKRLEEYSGG